MKTIIATDRRKITVEESNGKFYCDNYCEGVGFDTIGEIVCNLEEDGFDILSIRKYGER